MPRAFLVLLILTNSVRSADWPRFLGPDSNGHSMEEGLRRDWPPDGPPKRWEISTGSGFAGPAVAQGRLVLFHRRKDEEVLDCLDAKTGKNLWRFTAPTGYVDDFDFDDGPRAVPAISDGHVFALGAEGRLICCELATGKLLWQRELAKDYPFRKGYFGVGVSPLVENDLVVVNVGSRDAGVVAFDRRTGRERWRNGRDAASYSTPLAATIGSRRCLVFLTRQGLLVLDAQTGDTIHQRPFRARIDASVNAASPLVADGRVFLTASYGVGALLLDADGWREVWKGDALECHYNTPVKVNNHLFGSHGRQEAGASLRCVEWTTGTVAWEKEGFGCAWLIAVDGLLIAVRESGRVTLLEASPAAYREFGDFQAFDKPDRRNWAVRAAPAFADGILYIRAPERLAAWKLK
ncbi:MAG: PQQ-like beta-propeller repeat protein [Gemmataceae bacterium]|nr:PQQ-like beta-propeller repeat protein [Gemmataceae bacterium]